MTDVELLERYVSRNDRGALDQLLGRHYPAVYSVALRLVHNEFDARDVAQSVFLQAIRKAHTVRDPARFRYWLLKVAVNEARQLHRRSASRPKADPLFDAYVASRPETVTEEIGRREFELELERALETFPEELKTPLVLRYYQSLSLQEIADVLELPKSTVQSRCSLGLRRLRKRFSRDQMAAFSPFLKEFSFAASSVSAALAGGLVMKVLALTLAAGALLWLAWPTDGDPSEGDGVTAQHPPLRGGGDATDQGAASSDGAPRLRADLEGSSAVAREASTPGARREVVSSGEGVLRGRLLTLADGRPVVGAEVRVVPTGDGEGNSVRFDDPKTFTNRYVSQADGSFVCDELPVPGTYAVHVHHPSYGYSTRGALRLRASRSEADAGVILQAIARTLKGMVVDGAGKPIQGAAVVAGAPHQILRMVRGHASSGRPRGPEVRSKATGRYELRGLAPGNHHVRVERAGYATALRFPVHVPSRGDVPELSIVLKEALPVTGRVVDDQGDAVSGARVSVQLRESVMVGTEGYSIGSYWSQTTSDAQGHFRIDDLPAQPRTSLGVSASHPDFPDETYSDDVLPGTTDIVLVLEHPEPALIRTGGTTVTVEATHEGRTITDKGGYADLQGEAGHRRSPIDPDTGQATFEHVAPGSYSVSVRVAQFMENVISATIKDAPTHVRVPVERGSTIFGRVTDEVSGEPIAGAALSSHVLGDTVSDADGWFEQSGIRARGSGLHGHFTLRAKGYFPLQPVVKTPPEHRRFRQDFVLVPRSRAAVLKGQVLDGEGRGIPGARVEIEIGPTTHQRFYAYSDERGHYEFKGINPTAVFAHTPFSVRRQGYAAHEARLERSAWNAAHDVRLHTGRSITGQVLDQDDNPVAGATVTVIRSPGAAAGRSWMLPQVQGAAGGRTDAKGRFALTNLPTSALHVIAVADGHRYAEGPDGVGTRLPPGTENIDDVTVRTERGMSLRGRVVDESGAPLPGVALRCDGVMSAQVTDREGRFAFDAVFRQGVTVQPHGRSGRWLTGSLKNADRKRQPLRLMLTRCGEISGQVTRSDGTPLNGAIIELLDGRTVERRMETKHEGRFDFTHVPLGSRTVRISHPDLPEAQSQHEVEVRYEQVSDLGPLVLAN